jgi:hypothetical protein
MQLTDDYTEESSSIAVSQKAVNLLYKAIIENEQVTSESLNNLAERT